jgi:hypothetical protein
VGNGAREPSLRGPNLAIRPRNMATITNKTPRPLSVDLPNGKKLRLGGLASAEVNSKAMSHPAVTKLVEAGTVVIVSGTGKHAGGKSATGAPGAAGGRDGGREIRKTGNR